MTKKRTRLYIVGQATFRLISLGVNSDYSQTPARWACITCGAKTYGSPEQPWARDSACANNGHGPCRLCGAPLARLRCGCLREHQWNRCPCKTEADRVQPQHAHKGHLHRAEVSS